MHGQLQTHSSEESLSQVAWRVRLPAYVFKGSVGFTWGLYLSFAGPAVYESLSSINVRRGDSGNATISILSLGLNPIQWTLLVCALAHLLIALLQVPTGLFADTLGRRFCVVPSMWFRCLYFLFCFLATGLGTEESQTPTGVLLWAALAWALFAIHYALQDGALDAWMIDALAKTDQKHLG